ncbi:hypothetical protein A9Q99_01125 [Gammaproteobacteria bacterium 45_16_T64]|nr:hypothetical protein A9Q99_01125 [Gammaproteobacteria bacterium 45_16_T64]
MRTVDDFALNTQILKRFYTKNISLSPHSENLREIFENNHKLVIALNHGPILAPGAVNVAIADLYLKHGGANRTPMGIIWKHFYKVPVIKKMVAYITQVEEAFNLDEFIDQFVEKDYNDLMVMPEGENCCFGDAITIQPFLSPRFIEIAVRAEVPILIAVHHGTHVLASPLEVSSKYNRWFKKVMPNNSYQRLKDTQTISLPKFGAGKIDIECSFKLYHPTLNHLNLAKNKEDRMQQLWHESDIIRAHMQSMMDEIQQSK